MRVPTPILSKRMAQREPVPWQELLPLRLKDSVSGKGDNSNEVSCLQEMMILFSCLKTNEFSQAPCFKEIGTFQTCYSDYLRDKATRKDFERKGLLTPGSKNLGFKQINQVLKKFPAAKPKVDR